MGMSEGQPNSSKGRKENNRINAVSPIESSWNNWRAAGFDQNEAPTTEPFGEKKEEGLNKSRKGKPAGMTCGRHRPIRNLYY